MVNMYYWLFTLFSIHYCSNLLCISYLPLFIIKEFFIIVYKNWILYKFSPTEKSWSPLGLNATQFWTCTINCSHYLIFFLFIMHQSIINKSLLYYIGNQYYSINFHQLNTLALSGFEPYSVLDVNYRFFTLPLFIIVSFYYSPIIINKLFP